MSFLRHYTAGIEHLATGHSVRAREFLRETVDDLKAYFAKTNGASSVGTDTVSVPTISQNKSTLGKTDWSLSLVELLREYKNASPEKLPALRERARSILEIPKSDRMMLVMDFLTINSEARNIAKQGAAIIERYVSPDLFGSMRIQIQSTEKSRSFYRNGTVYLGTRASQMTAAHEIMHDIEKQNPQLLEKAACFLFQRAEGEAALSLADLTGKNYGKDERAFKDRWEQNNGAIYAGKVYSENDNPTKPSQLYGTEILTMGIQRLFADPLEFCYNDVEWFNFTMNALKDL